MDWKPLWQQKAAAPDFLTQTGRGNSFNLDKFLLYLQDVNAALQLDKSDTLLDIGGASGWVTLFLSPFVNSVTMFDYSDKMIEKAEQLTYGCTNTSVFQDNILSMKYLQGTYSKVLVGSVLQYLNNMDEVEQALRKIYNVMPYYGKCLLTHNPDISKKKSHLATASPETLEMENARLWLDFDDVHDIAMSTGFKSCRKLAINPLIWQSSHMFDFVLTK